MDYTEYNIEFDAKKRRLQYKLIDGQVLNYDQVFHIPGPSMDGYVGMSIIEHGAGAIALGKSYETFGKNFYDNGAMPSGVFEHPAFLKDAAYERLRKHLDQSYTGLMNTGRPMLLEHGLQYKQLTIKPVDAQMLENRRFQVEDVCRFCRVPPHMVQDLSRSTNNNIEHQSLEFIRFTMLPYFRRCEEAVRNQLLSEQERLEGYYFEFDLGVFLRGDSTSMAQSFAAGRQWGWYSVNDIRKMLNLNGIGEEGDIYMQPVNMVEAGTEFGNPSQDNQDTSNDEENQGEEEPFFDVSRKLMQSTHERTMYNGLAPSKK